MSCREVLDVLRALERGALLFDDTGGGARLGYYLSEGSKNTPVRGTVFRSMDEAGYIAPVFASRAPQRWRATDVGKAFLADQDRAVG